MARTITQQIAKAASLARKANNLQEQFRIERTFMLDVNRDQLKLLREVAVNTGMSISELMTQMALDVIDSYSHTEEEQSYE